MPQRSVQRCALVSVIALLVMPHASRVAADGGLCSYAMSTYNQGGVYESCSPQSEIGAEIRQTRTFTCSGVLECPSGPPIYYTSPQGNSYIVLMGQGECAQGLAYQVGRGGLGDCEPWFNEPPAETRSIGVGGGFYLEGIAHNMQVLNASNPDYQYFCHEYGYDIDFVAIPARYCDDPMCGLCPGQDFEKSACISNGKQWSDSLCSCYCPDQSYKQMCDAWNLSWSENDCACSCDPYEKADCALRGFYYDDVWCYCPDGGDGGGGSGGDGGGGDTCDPGDEWWCENVELGTFNDYTCECEQDNWEDPLLVSLDRRPIRLSDPRTGVWFDANDDGVLERVSWTAARSNVGFLVLDQNANGTIDSGGEMFAVNWRSDSRRERPVTTVNSFTSLRMFDAPVAGGNGDGAIDSSDAIFHGLRIWVDKNHDGKSQAGELLTMSDAGLSSIGLAYRTVGRRDSNGNYFRYRGVVSYSDGSPGTVWDVFLRELR